MLGMILGLFCLVDVSAGLSLRSVPVVSTTAAAATRPAGALRVFVDRFGTLYYHRRRIEIKTLAATQPAPKEVIILYDPFSLAAVRQQTKENLEKAFPRAHVILEPVGDADSCQRFRFPDHQPAVQNEILGQKTAVWDQFFSRRFQLVEQIQSYLKTLTIQLTRVRSEIGSLHLEYQHLTTQKSEK